MPDCVDGALENLTTGGEVHHARLVATLEQAREELGVDLPLEVLEAPFAALGLYLVEAPLGFVLDVHEEAVVRPAEERRKSIEARVVPDGALELFRNATCAVANPPARALRVGGGGRARFATSDVANRRGAVGVRQVEGPEVAEIRGGIAPPEAALELGREYVQNPIAILGSDGSRLVVLDDLASDLPVRDHHRAVHRANNLGAGFLEDRDDALEQRADVVGPAISAGVLRRWPHRR